MMKFIKFSVFFLSLTASLTFLFMPHGVRSVPQTNALIPDCTAAFRVPMQPGDFNHDVRHLQTFLIDSGFDIPAGATSYYGTQTKAAVTEFQMRYSFEILYPLHLYRPTGIAWYATLAQINALLCL